MRWMYARQNPAENLLFGPKKANEVRRQFYLLLWNIFKFYRDYAAIDGVKINEESENLDSDNILDKWLLSQFKYTVENIIESLNKYSAKGASDVVETFISDFSTWYIRRSRDRVGPSSENKKDKDAFYSTTHFVLKNLSIVLSPFMPFITEELYMSLSKGESVHLESWPVLKDLKYDADLAAHISAVRSIAEVGHRVRKELKIKVRQPLASLVTGIPKNQNFLESKNKEDYDKLLMDELNVKQIEYKKEESVTKYDTNITPELKLEGEVRDLLRSIQQKRKELGVQISESVYVEIPKEFEKYTDMIKKQVNASHISIGHELKVEKNI